MNFIDVTSETRFLHKQWNLGKRAAVSGDQQVARHHYDKARTEALWLLDYATARGEPRASLLIHKLLDQLHSDMADALTTGEHHGGPISSSRDTTRLPLFYGWLHFMQRLVPNGQQQTLTRVKI